MKAIVILGFWAVFSTSTFVDPAYPPYAITGGTVVAELHSVSGKVEELEIHSGEEPFLDSAKSALEQWSLHPDNDGEDLVIVHFRQPHLYYLNDASENIGGARPLGHLPYPKTIVGPDYPVQVSGQGSVILKIEISSEGSVTDVRAEKTAGALTDVSIDAVRKWKFLPAEDERGIATASSAYAVLVYRFPIIGPKK
jgi:TonB family protein